MPEEQQNQEAKPAEKKPVAENVTVSDIPAEIQKPAAQPTQAASTSGSKLTPDELAILNAMDMEKSEAKPAQPAPIQTSPKEPVMQAISQPAATSSATASPAPAVPEKKKFEFHLPFFGKPKEKEAGNDERASKDTQQRQLTPPQLSVSPAVSPAPSNPAPTAVPAPKTEEKRPLLPIFQKKPQQPKPAEQKPEQNNEIKPAVQPASISTEDKKSMKIPDFISGNWKKTLPVIVLIAIFATFLMARNSMSYMTGYAITGVPLLTNDYVSIIILGILAFLAIFGTEKLMNKMYKYM